MSDEEIEAIQRRVSAPGYVPPPYQSLSQRLAEIVGEPDTHRVRVSSTWWNVLGWECVYRYQAKCRCGWYGDEVKSKVTAEQQADWHLGGGGNHG